MICKRAARRTSIKSRRSSPSVIPAYPNPGSCLNMQRRQSAVDDPTVYTIDVQVMEDHDCAMFELSPIIGNVFFDLLIFVEAIEEECIESCRCFHIIGLQRIAMNLFTKFLFQFGEYIIPYPWIAVYRH